MRRATRASLLLLVLLALGALGLRGALKEGERLIAERRDPSDAVAPASGTSGPPPAPDYVAPDATQFSVVVERPLLSPSRRPGVGPAPRVQAAEAAPADTPAVRLLGVVSAGADRIALVTRAEGGPVRRLREGDVLDGWEAALIEADSLVLRRGDSALTLRLSFPATTR